MIKSIGAGALNQTPLRVELPNKGEILTMPFFSNAFYEDVYKVMPASQREIFDKFPLKYDKKYVLATFKMRFLNKNVCAYPDEFVSYQKKWHVPTSIDLVTGEQDRYLHMISSAGSTLEISANDHEFDFDHSASTNPVRDFNFWLLKNLEESKVDSFPLTNNVITEYDGSTLIRNVDANCIEFRLDIRLIETDNYKRFKHNDFEVQVHGYRGKGTRTNIQKGRDQTLSIVLPDIYADDLTHVK